LRDAGPRQRVGDDGDEVELVEDELDGGEDPEEPVDGVAADVVGVLDCSPDDLSAAGFESVPPFSDSRAFLRAADG
jgi:hypothetical protein